MNTYSTKISELEADAIKRVLLERGACFDKAPYSFWRAKSPDFSATFYESKKFLIQGKDIADIVKQIEQLLNINTIKQSLDNDSDNIHKIYIGTDESGKGDFFGPLVIAGVQLNEKNKALFIQLGIKDSKKLDDEKIKKLAVYIKNNSFHSVVVINPQKYNELYDKFKNLNKLLAWGHARAIENILEKNPCSYALSDKFGDESLIKNALLKNGRCITLDQRIKAESDIAVAAASILARAEFVKRISELETKYSMKFSKGVSDKVLIQAKDFVKKYTSDELKCIAKIHFKTTKEVLK